MRRYLATWLTAIAYKLDAKIPAVARMHRARGYAEGWEDAAAIIRGEDVRLVEGHRCIVWEHEEGLTIKGVGPLTVDLFPECKR